MARKSKIPWLDYTGQDTAHILACKSTHRIDSLLCALEQAIQLRATRMPEVSPTPEELTLLAIMALQREVNNGGYHQFFVNSSRQYALPVVLALTSIGCEAAAALTQKAIDALNLHPPTLKAIEDAILKPDPARDRALDELDQHFYRISGLDAALFTFVESRQQAFVIETMPVAPRPPKRGSPNLIRLGVALDFAPKTDLSFEAVRELAAELAVREEIEPTDAELDGAAYLFLFKSSLKAGQLEQCKGSPDPPSIWPAKTPAIAWSKGNGWRS